MALILNIETCSPVCSVALAEGGTTTVLKEIVEPANHAAILTVLINDLLREGRIAVARLDAIGVNMGPGSYTGLRIGVATAKGLCYTLKKPLVGIDSLRSLAVGMSHRSGERDALYCPIIDARRMEVYYGLYTAEGKVIKEPSSAIVGKGFLKEEMKLYSIIAGGDGLKKSKPFLEGNIEYDEVTRPSARWLEALSEADFSKKNFRDLFSFEPFYMKPVYITSAKHRG